MMKSTLAAMAITLSLGLVALDAEAAKRLGGGKSSGMQRQNVTEQAKTPPGTPASPNAAPGQQAAPATAGAAAAAPAAAAAAQKRSWMGPLAGLAAGLGLAALASYLGFGEAFANFLMIALLVVAVIAVIGFVMRKRAAAAGGTGAQPALAGAGGAPGAQAGGWGAPAQPQNAAQPLQRGSLIGSRIGSGLGGGAALPTQSRIPADFDAAGFARNAKNQFMALQAANDARDLKRLRDFLTPEMFAQVTQDLADRGDAPQTTEVFGLEAAVLDVTEEADRYIVSVRFTGSVRSEPGVEPDALDEVWHLTKTRTGNEGWVIAGIEQVT